ncbi:ergothioneine biosynthesis protein EgtB [Betaproteobacteria bacterium SCN2]|jgi:ergothioneine biosynthesis protein EgtB|nr:ergothioneine biosynthesis protein EgtB [Betaproteobacteria bacterium SCN2]
MTFPTNGYSAAHLVSLLREARADLDAFAACLPEQAWLGPRAATLNPPLWEYGHIVWFQERWCLRQQDDGSVSPPRLPNADALYDSSQVAHDTRWDLPLPGRDALADFSAGVLRDVADKLDAARPDDPVFYFAELSLYHERMHLEAWWMMAQCLGYRPPLLPPPASDLPLRSPRRDFAAGTVALGADDSRFRFDNEKRLHHADLSPFAIDLHPVSQGAFLEFVEAGGYATPQHWSSEGRAWLAQSGAGHPVYWRQEVNAWQVRRFDRWQQFAPGEPMLHLNRFEAEAFAAWRGARLPSAAEWQRASRERDFNWGHGWEWCAEAFAPYPGFAPDPYRDYSSPWFHSHWELRGGSPVTHALLKRPGFRNFYLPERRDAFTGLRLAWDNG